MELFKIGERISSLKKSASPICSRMGLEDTAIEGENHDIGFANYVRHRVMSSDSKYMKDYIYIFFLHLVKELFALKR